MQSYGLINNLSLSLYIGSTTYCLVAILDKTDRVLEDKY